MTTQSTAARLGGTWRAELFGWVFAAALSVAVVARVATVSAELLFTDGDSLIVPLVIRSLAAGQPQEWAMSPVLFLPEIAGYGVLSALGGGLRATLMLAGVANLLALYGALRVVAGRRGAGRRPVWGATTAFTVVALLGFLEGTARRDGAQFVSLFVTTSYYALTMIALLLCVGLARRALDGGRRPVAAALGIALLGAVATLSNPLFAVWAFVSAGVALTIVALRMRRARRTALTLVAALVVGSAGGYLARGLFAGMIVAQSGNYFRFGQLERSVPAYARVLAETVSTPGGAVAAVLGAALWIGAIAVAVDGGRRRDPAVFAVGLAAAAGPPLLTAGAILLGTNAARYLQPWLFLPLAALAVVASLQPVARHLTVPVRRAATATAGGVAVVALALGVPVAAAAASGTDRDLDCVVRWVDGSGRTGAGQFWTVRAPKAQLADPARLVQVDHTLRVYTWLTNRADARGAEVTFLLTDGQTPRFALPPGFSRADATEIGCGRYTILDFGDRVLPLGPPRA